MLKSIFHHNPYRDSVIFVKHNLMKNTFLFDCGNISRFSQREILRVKYIFISHTHMDHFIGMDHFVRNCLGKERTINIFGPKNIIKNVHNKIHGYTWNLNIDKQLTIYINEIENSKLKRAVMRSSSHFKLFKLKSQKIYDNVLFDNSYIKVQFTYGNHMIPVLLYVIREHPRPRINKENLARLNVKTGPWVSEFVKDVINNTYMENEYHGISGKKLFEKIIDDFSEDSVGYVTDTIYSEQLIKNLERYFKNVNTLYCEAPFLHEDIELANESYHLTSKQAGEIGKILHAKKLKLFHFSKRYANNSKMLIKEAMKVFTGM